MTIRTLATIAGRALYRLWDYFCGCIFWLLCGIAALVTLGVFINLLTASLSLIVPPSRDTSRLPGKLVTSATIYTADEIGGFLEGCVMEIHQLSPETAAAIRRQGLAFFRDMPQPRKGGRFGPWRETPIPEKPNIFATGALNGCRNDDTATTAMGGR